VAKFQGFLGNLMVDKREKSRGQWRQEIVARQQNVIPADFPEGLHHVSSDGLVKIPSQARFWIGIAVFAVGVWMYRTSIPPLLAVATMAGGLCLAISAMRWRNAR